MNKRNICSASQQQSQVSYVNLLHLKICKDVTGHFDHFSNEIIAVTFPIYCIILQNEYPLWEDVTYLLAVDESRSEQECASKFFLCI